MRESAQRTTVVIPTLQRARQHRAAASAVLRSVATDARGPRRRRPLARRHRRRRSRSHGRSWPDPRRARAAAAEQGDRPRLHARLPKRCASSAPSSSCRWTPTSRIRSVAARAVRARDSPLRPRPGLPLPDRHHRRALADRAAADQLLRQRVRAPAHRCRCATRPAASSAGGARRCERSHLEQVRSNGYAFQIEMTYRAWRKGHRIREMPIIFMDRTVGDSKMSKTIGLEALWIVWWLRIMSLRGRL